MLYLQRINHTAAHFCTVIFPDSSTEILSEKDRKNLLTFKTSGVLRSQKYNLTIQKQGHTTLLVLFKEFSTILITNNNTNI